MSLGKLIREARQRIEWTQSQLAEKLGVTASFVTKMEKDESVPSYDRLIALARILDLKVDVMLTLVEQVKADLAEKRTRARGVAVRSAYGIDEQCEVPVVDASINMRNAAEQLGRQILDDPELNAAFAFLCEAFRDLELRPVVLKTLEVFARQAHAG